MATPPISHRTILLRIAVAACFVGAFVVMASVISPDRTRAADGLRHLQNIPPKSVEYAAPFAPESTAALLIPARASALAVPSTDPHDGLLSLGAIESFGYTIHIYATECGPRYTIYENVTGSECGALLSQDQVQRAFPELQLPDMEFNAEGPLMMMIDDGAMWAW